MKITPENFEEVARSGYYRLQRENAYHRQRNGLERDPGSDTFDVDLEAWLLFCGVPERYVAKVARFAYQEGHSSGEEEILNVAYGLLEIFE